MGANSPEHQARASRFPIPSLAEIFGGPLAKWYRRVAKWRKRGLLGKAFEAQRREMRFEALEPRLLLSADFSYTTGATDLTLKAISAAEVALFDGSTQVDAQSLNDGVINIQRSGGGSGTADTIHLAADTFVNLDASSAGIAAHGNLLAITFDGGDQRVNPDTVTLDGTASLPFGLSVTSNSKITSNSNVDVTGDLSLQSKQTAGNDNQIGDGLLANANTGITLTGAQLTASHNLTLTADSTIDVTPTDANGSKTGDTSTISDSAVRDFVNQQLGNLSNETGVSLVTSFSQAKIDIGGGSKLQASSGDIEILSSVDGSIEANTSHSARSVTIAVAAGKADPWVTIHGTDTSLTAGGKIDATAKTNFSKFDVEATSHGNSDTSLDGAVAVSVFDAGARLDVSGGAKLSATGAATLAASSTLPMTVKGDASTGGTAGAGVGVAVALGDTSAAINGSEVDGSAVSLTSTSNRTITTTADSSGEGSSTHTGTDKNASESTLSGNNAQANDGSSTQSISIAGAVAVSVDDGTTSASTTAGTIDAGSGAVTILATPVDVVTTAADASFTNSSSGVGVAVAINIADARDNSAFVDGSSTITGGSLTVAVGALNSGAPDPASLSQSSFSAIAVAGVSSQDTGVAGSFAINVIITDNEAYIADGATVTLVGSPNVTIEADSNLKEVAIAVPIDGGGGGGSLGVGASVAFNYGEDTTAADIGDGATLSGANDLTLNATSTRGMTSSAQNGAAAVGGTGITPVVAISAANNDAHTTIGSGSELTIGGDLKATSKLSDTVSTTATGSTSASTGVGVSLALSIVNDSSMSTTERYLTTGGVAAFMSSATSGSESTAKASAKGGQNKSNDSKSTADSKKSQQQDYAAGTAKTDGAKKSDTTKNTSLPSASSGSGGVSVAGAIAINFEGSSSVASIPDDMHVTAPATITVKSSNNSDGHAVADASATGGSVGVGVAAAVNSNDIKNLGYVGNNTEINGGGLDVGATVADHSLKAPVLGTPNVVTLDSSTDTTFRKDSIYLGLKSGLKTGDEVKYDANSHTAVSGLTDGKSYYVNVAGDGTVRFYGDGSGHGNGLIDAQLGSANYNKLTGAGSGTQKFDKYVSGSPDTAHALKFSAAGNAEANVVSLDDDPSASLFQKDSIFVGKNFGPKSGDKVAFVGNIGGLTTGATYFVHVNGDGTIRLYDASDTANKAHAEADDGTGLMKLTSSGSGTQTFSPIITISGIDVPNLFSDFSFTAGAQVTLLNVSGGQLRTGDPVTYDAKGGAAINLASSGTLDGSGGTTYYAIDLGHGRYELAASRDDAYAGKAIALNGGGNAGEVLHDLADSSRAEATSGAGGSDVGIGVSVAVNVVNNDTEAMVGWTPGTAGPIASTASVTISDHAGNEVEISAASEEANLARAVPHGESDGDNAGIGASVAVNVLTNTVSASIADGTAWKGTADSFKLEAESGDSAFTHGENGAKGGTGIGVGVGILVGSDTTTAYVGTTSDPTAALSATGEISVTASHTGEFNTETDAEAAGKSVGVGASISIAWLTETVSAELARDVTSSNGAVTVESTSSVATEAKAVSTVKGNSDKSDKSDKQADSQVNGDNKNTNGKGISLPSADSNSTNEQNKTSQEGSKNGSSVGIAGSIAVNRLMADNTAKLSGADVTAHDAVTIAAHAQYDASAKAIGSVNKMDDKSSGANIGAGVSVNWVGATNKALVEGGSTVIGDGITVEATTPAGETNDFVAWGAAAVGGKGSMSIAGSVGINIIDHFDTEASTASGSHLESSGGITVKGIAYLGPQTLAAAGAFSKDSGALGATIDITVLHASTTAAINGDADAAGAILVDAESHMVPTPIELPLVHPALTSVAVAGAASQSDPAFAGSFIVNDIHVDVDAHIGASSQVNKGDLYTVGSGQTVTVEATNETKIVSVAGALGLSIDSSGVGVGLDVEILHKTTKAYIGDSAQVGNDAGGAVSVTADSTETMISVAGTAGVGGGSVGVAASIGIADIHVETDAYIGNSATVRSGGTVTVDATSAFVTTMVAGAIGVGDTGGIGLANTTLVHSATVQAYVGPNSTVRADGDMEVVAKASEDVIAIAAGAAAGGDVGVAGSAAVNVLNEHTTADIGHGSTITVVGAHDLTVKATDDTGVTTVAGSLAASGTAGVGVGVGVGVFTKDTNAFIGSAVTATVGGNILVEAASSESLISVSAGLAIGGTAGVGANADVNVFNLHTRAFIGDDPRDELGLPNSFDGASYGPGDVHATGTVGISADDETSINEITAVIAVSGTAGIGAAAGVNVMNKDTEAFIGSGAKVTADGQGAGADVNTGAIAITLTPVASGDTFSPNDPKGQGIETKGSGTRSSAESDNPTDRQNLRSGGQVKTPQLGPMKTGTNTNSSDPSKNGDQNVSDPSLSNVRSAGPDVQPGFHGVAVGATNQDEIRTFTFSVGAGEVGVAVTAGVDVVNATTKAYIGDHAQVNADTSGANAGQQVLVGAADDFYHLAIAGSLGIGVVGVAPAVGVNVIDNTTEAYIGDHATVNALDNISVEAGARENVVMIGFGVAGGFVGVGGAVNVLSIGNATKAHIDADATVYAGGDVLVSATDDTHVLELSGAVAGGAVGVGGSVGVMVIHKDTEATIGAGAQVDALGNGSGHAGVLHGTITGDSFDKAAAHGVIVQAESSEELTHIVAAGGFGFVGVSGAVGVTLISGETDAAILGGAEINTLHQGGASSSQSVHVGADDHAKVNTYVIGIGAGFVGVSGAIDVGNLNDNVKAVIGADATVNAEQDVDVYALSLKDFSGFDASGSGGFVGVGGAVSVWSIGTKIQKTGKDKNGNDTSTSALDAAAHKVDTSAVDTGAGTINLGGKGGFGNGTEVVYHSNGGSEIGGDVHDGGHYYVHAENDHGLISLYDNAQDAQAGGSHGRLTLGSTGNSNQTLSGVNGSADSDAAAQAVSGKNQVTNSNAGGINNFTGDSNPNSNRSRISDAISGSGGADDQINAAAPTQSGITGAEDSAPPPAADPAIPNGTSAVVKAGAQLNAGGGIGVIAHAHDTFSVTAGQAAVGFVGAGASVAVLSIGDNVAAFADGTLHAGSASAIKVSAILDDSTNLLALDAAGGFVGVGAAVVVVNDSSQVQASLGNVTQAGDVTVSADSNRNLTEHTDQVSVGAVAAGASYTSLDVSGGTSATVDGGAQIGQSGTVQSLTVTASDAATTDLHTVAVSAGIGAMSANFANVNIDPKVSATIGNDAQVNVVNGVNVDATAAPQAKAEVIGVSVGVGAGLGVSYAKANTDVDVTATVGDGVIIAASTLAVAATLDLPSGPNTKNAYAKAVAGGGGILVGVQGAYASATTGGTVAASLGKNVSLPDGGVTVTGFNHSRTQSDATGVGIGFVGIGMAEADATSNVHTSATTDTGLNTSSTRNGALTINAVGNSTTVAASTAGSGGVVAGNGSEANAADNSTASASIGATGHTIHASDVTISSENDAYYFAHSDSTNAAVLGASGAFAEFDGNTSSTTTLPDNLTIAATGVVEISSTNNYYSTPGGTVGEPGDNVDAAGGGGISATAAFSTTNLTGHSTVNIGDNLNISAVNDPETDKASIGIDAGSQLISNDLIKLETGGAIDGAGVNSSLTGHLHTSVNIGTGANFYSTQNIGIGTYTIVVGHLEADSSTWGLAAVGFSDAHLNVDTHETIDLGSGAQMLGLGNVNIRTGDDSTGQYQTSLTGTTSAQSYVRGVIAVPAADASTYFDSNQQTNIYGATIHSGRNTSIGADPHDPVANADGTGHGYELGFIPVTDGSSDSHANVTAHVDFNGTAIAGFYHELTLNIDGNGSNYSGTGFVRQNANSVPVTVSYDPSFNPRDFVNNAPGGDTTNNALLVQYLQDGTVGALRLGDMFAAAGNVIVDATNVTGSGLLEAHGAPTITVNNASKDYLVIDGTMTIPFSTGGHVVFTGGASDPAGITKSENNVDEGGVISIHNTYGGTYGSPATGPGLILAGEVSNLGGLVDLVNDEGSIIVTNAIYAQNVSVRAPNGAFAVSYAGTAVLGAAPMSEWDNVINWPGGDPHTALDISNLNPNAAISYVANSEHPGFSSSSSMMSALLLSAYTTNKGPSIVYLGDGVPHFSGTTDKTANEHISPLGTAYQWDHYGSGSYFPNIPLETLTVTRAAGDWSGASPSPAGDPGHTGHKQSSINVGTAVLISADAVDLNTHIEVGPPTDWSVDLPAALTVPVFGGLMHVNLNTYRNMWRTGLVATPVIDLPVNTVNMGDALVTATYDARTGQINLENVKASGGSGIVRIKGALVNTNDLGNIQVNGGLGHVTVDNQTSVPLAVADIYAGSAQTANASTSIVDLLDTNTNVQTMYTYRPGHGINVYTGALTDSMEQLRGTTPSYIAGNSTQFDPQAGWRLEWKLQATLKRTLSGTNPKYTLSNWIFNTPTDSNNPWEFYQYTGTYAGTFHGANSPSSKLIFDPSNTSQFSESIVGSSSTTGGYTIYIDYFNYDGFAINGNYYSSQDKKTEPGSEHGFQYPGTASLTLTMSVRADNPVGILFAGHDRGLIDINSNANVYLDGTLTNPSGDTNITVTDGSISLPTSQSKLAQVLLQLAGGSAGTGSTPPILTNNLDLSASGGVGTVSDPITATLTAGGILDATSGAAGIHLVLGSGALIDSVAAGSSGHYGDVSIAAAGSLLAHGGGTNVSGRDLTLTTSIGTIGTISDPLVIAAHATALANGGFSHGFVTVDAPGDVGLRQVGGDLVVNSIRSEGGDVYIDVTNGAIYDQRSMTPAQLLSESAAGALWSRLHLTAAYGVDTLTGETVTAFEGQVNRNYEIYWNLLDNGSVSGGTFTLDADKLDMYRAQASAKLGHDASDTEVQDYANSLYQTLDNFFTATIGAGYATTAPFLAFDSNYNYVATSTQSDNLKRNAVWTDNELKYFVNRTALEPAAGTPVPPTQPNIFGNDVTLHAYGSVGKLAAPVSISIADIQNGTLTDEQAAALALASAPGDVTFVGLDAHGQVVTFSYTGSHTLPAGVASLTGIKVKELAPFFVAATGSFDATSDNGAVFVQSTAADLNLGYVSAATDASLIAPQDILSAGTHPSLQIHTGHDLSLLAGAGDIAASNTPAYSPLKIQVGGTLVSAAAGHVLDIEEITGDLRFERLASGGDSFVSVPNGSLLQVADGIGVGANNLTIDSQTDIGSAGQYLTILLEAPDGRLYADAGGDIYIYSASGTVNPAGDLNIGHVFSAGGDVTLEADGSILNPDASGNASIHGNTISLTAHNGSVGVVGHDLLVDSRYSAAGVVNAAVTGGDLYLIETIGDLYLGAVTLDPAGGPHTAHLVAATGDIRNGLGSGVNVTADKLWLAAAGAIGTASDSITTAVTDIAGRASAGGIYIDQYGAVYVGHVLDNHDAVPPQGLSASGEIVFTAHSPITVDADVIAGGSITLTSIDSALDDLITVSAGVTVMSTSSSVSVLSGDGVWQKSGSTIQAATRINIEVDHNSTDPGVGATARLDGTLNAPLIVISGNADPDTLILHPDAVAGHVEMFGGGGSDLLVVDRMPNLDLANKFNANTGPARLNTGAPFGARNTVDLDGQGAGDHYVINLTGNTDYIVNVHDSGNLADGVDTLTINGVADQSNVFLMRAKFVANMQPADPGNPGNGSYGEYYERINYDTTVNLLEVNGGTQSDYFYVDDNSAITVLDGGPGEDHFQFGQMFGAERVQPNVAPGDEIATVLTTSGYLSRGISYATTAYGGDQNDTFTVYSNKAPLKLFGEAGNDTFIVRAFIIAQTNTVATTDTLVNSGAGNDYIEYNINAPVSIDGGTGFDTVVVVGTEANDNFVITKDGVMGAGLNVNYTNVEKVEVDGLGGNDNFWVLSTSPDVVTVLDGGQGSDTFNVAGDVTGKVVAYNADGTSAFINHSVASSDPAFNGIFAPGIPVNVGGPAAGQVVVTQNPGGTTVVQGGPAGTEQSSYSVHLAVDPTTLADGTIWYMTVAAAPNSYNDRNAGAKSIQLSTDGSHWSSSLLLAFDKGAAAGSATDWNRTQTIYVRATANSVKSGDATIEVMHSIQSTNTNTPGVFGNVVVPNVDVHVVDAALPGLVVTTPVSGMHVVEGGLTASYTAELLKAPKAGETVTVALASDDPRLQFASTSMDPRFTAATSSTPATLTFDSTNWDTPVDITVSALDNHVINGERLSTISSTVTSSLASGGVYSNGVVDNPQVKVDVIDGDSGGVLVLQSGGNTTVSQGHPDTYTLQLTKAPHAGDSVTVSILSDGKTLVSSTDPRFNAGTGTVPPSVTFNSTNWNNPVTIQVDVNPNAPADAGTQPVQVFPAQAHMTSSIYGPLLIEGNSTAPRALVQGVRLPTENDVPLPPPPQAQSDATKVDTLNVFDDGYTAGDTGHMGSITQAEFASLASLYDPSLAPTDSSQIGEIDGLSMGGAVTFSDGLPAPITFAGGIAYHNVDVVDVMLGTGNDKFTVDSTVQGTITVVQGGGGNDHLIANGGGGPGAPLILFGDTSQDGSFYNSLTTDITGGARQFVNPGDDTIDASNDPNSVAIYGGGGNDTIYGGSAGDWIAGGSGDDTIYGGGGNDNIYGDDGFNIDLSKRLDLSTQILTVVNQATGTEVAATGDRLVAGKDTISGGGGSDIIIGDHGVIDQVQGTNRILTTGSVTEVYTVRPDVGGNDTLNGDAGNDLILGGYGSDTIHGGANNDVAIGDNGDVRLATSGPAPERTVMQVTTTYDSIGNDDIIYGDGGDDVLIGGVGNDAIDGGLGKDLIFGDNVRLDRSSTYDDLTNPRFRALQGTQIYSTAAATMGQALVDTVWQQDPNGPAAWTDFRITLVEDVSGNDYIAGGGGDDQIFGQLGDDVIQGDGSIDIAMTGGQRVYAYRDASNALQINPSFDAPTDGSDYIEGGGGNDTIFGNQGQDDIVGGNSDLFSLTGPNTNRPDGSNMIFGGSGTAIGLNDPGATGPNAQAHDADTIVANNGDIFRLVGTNGADSGAYLRFNYDVYGNPGASEWIVPRAVTLLDYTPGGPDYAGTAGPRVPGDVGGTMVNGQLKGSEIHGEAGNDFLYGGPGNDVIFGDGQNDSIVGGYGADWISGGAGNDGILGDDGRIFSSRPSTSYGEPLYGIAPVAATNQIISDLHDALVATINVVDANGVGKLTYTAELTPDNLDPNHAAPDVLFRPLYANDIIYGGLGNDSIHGGAGDDAISGAEALPIAYTTNYDQNGAQIGKITESDFYHPYNPGNPLGYNPSTTKFALYDAADPLRKILLNADGTLNKDGTGVEWILNFDQTQGPTDTHWVTGSKYSGVPTDGDDRIFGDLGNDWAVGGTGRDTIYGGWGDDLINLDDNLNTNGGLNNGTDTNPSYEDYAFGGAGRDVLIANTGGDRMIDWVGEFNTYLVPFSPFGAETVDRLPQPALQTFLLQLSQNDGADPWVGINHGGTAARNGEPYGELGMVVQGDSAWRDQTGGPRDPQPGNSHGSRDVRVSAGTLPIWQLASGPAPTVGDGDATLSAAQLAPIVHEAKLLWADALGTNDPHLAALDGVSVQVSDLPELALGETSGKSILIDGNAAGWGWFVDSTPQDSSEFQLHLANGALGATPGSPAYGHMDLLSTVMHEMGNAMGFPEDAQATGAVTSPYLSAGERLQTAGTAPSSSEQVETAPAPSSPTFDEYAGYGAFSANASIDWQGNANGGWEVKLSPYDTGKPAAGDSNLTPFDQDLLAKLDAHKHGADFDRMGQDLLGSNG